MQTKEGGMAIDMKLVKTIITIFVAGVCACVCLFSVGYFFTETDYTEYELVRMVQPVFHDVKAEYIGDTYGNRTEEGYSYYRLLFEIENPCNYGMDYFYFYYEGPEHGMSYSVWEVNESSDTLTSEWEKEFLPAGKTTNISRIVHVQNGCKEFDVVYENWNMDGKQKFHVEL